MTTNNINNNKDKPSYVAIQSLIEELCQTLKPVTKTLGPKGTTMFLNRMSGKLTKDGATVLKELFSSDENVNLLLGFVKDTIGNFARVVGDGTTSTTVLLINILKQTKGFLELGYNPISIVSGIKKAENHLINNILPYLSKSITLEEEDLMIKIGTVSSNGDEKIGYLLTKALQKVGSSGVVTIESSYSMEEDLKEEYTQGLSIDSGYISQYFCQKDTILTNDYQEKNEIEMKNPYILLVNKRIALIDEYLESILRFVSTTSRSLCIIAEDVEGEALANLVILNNKGAVNCVAIKAPGFGESKVKILEDIAVVTNSTLFNDKGGVSMYQMGHDIEKYLGSADRIQVKKNKTIIIQGHGDKELLKKRIEAITQQICVLEEQISPSSYELDNLRNRLAKLTGGIYVLKVGGANELAVGEKKDRITDALCAIKAAIKGGISPGSGLSFFLMGKFLEEDMNKKELQQYNDQEKIGMEILRKSLNSVTINITENCLSIAKEVVMDKLTSYYKDVTREDISMIIQDKMSYGASSKNPSFVYGFDAVNECFTDILAKGIINPTAVDQSCITTAVTIAQQILNSGYVITKPSSDYN